MKVSELIDKLKCMNQDANVSHLWDGELRTNINLVYMGKTGECVTSDYDERAYSNSGRPLDAPDAETDRFWRTPKEN